jgi:hypothetical protein
MGNAYESKSLEDFRFYVNFDFRIVNCARSTQHRSRAATSKPNSAVPLGTIIAGGVAAVLAVALAAVVLNERKKNENK